MQPPADKGCVGISASILLLNALLSPGTFLYISMPPITLKRKGKGAEEAKN